LKSIQRAILRAIPGTRLHLAAEKKAMERKLRKAGYSRSGAVTEVARRFKRHD